MVTYRIDACSENLSVFLGRKGFNVTVINPLLLKKHPCAATLRKTKTGKADTKGIALFLAAEGFQPDFPVFYHIQELSTCKGVLPWLPIPDPAGSDR